MNGTEHGRRTSRRSTRTKRVSGASTTMEAVVAIREQRRLKCDSRLRVILAAIAATVVSGAAVGCLSQPKESDFAKLQDAFRAEGIVLVPARKGDFAGELGCRLMDSKTENLTVVVCRNGVEALPILGDLGTSPNFRRFDDPRPFFKYLK